MILLRLMILFLLSVSVNGFCLYFRGKLVDFFCFVVFVLWCGYCKVFVLEYEEVVMMLKEKNIKFVKIDCIEEMEFC